MAKTDFWRMSELFHEASIEAKKKTACVNLRAQKERRPG
jgi:hypothetical protein